jgi:N-acetylglucosaminyl-diphospho-decaprenol L-rhamnosyltransferase
MSSISIVVVTWECAALTRHLVRSMNQHLSGDEQLIVVDNASSDDLEDAAREWKGELELILLPMNVGFGAASNLGVQRAVGDGIVLLNPDTELLDSSLGRLVDTALELNAIVGPRVLNPDGSVQASASGPEVGFWPWVRAVVPGSIAPPWIVRHTEPYRSPDRVEVTWLKGACLAGPRSVLLGLGPFDEAIHLYGEDLELGLRAGRAGIGSFFCPETCRIVHLGAGSSTVAFGSREAWRARAAVNWRDVLTRAYGPRRARRGRNALVLNLALRTAAKRFLRRPTVRDRAALAAVRGARGMHELG